VLQTASSLVDPYSAIAWVVFELRNVLVCWVAFLGLDVLRCSAYSLAYYLIAGLTLELGCSVDPCMVRILYYFQIISRLTWIHQRWC
jgi:hypothetical protein